MYKRRLDSKGVVIPDSVEKHKVRLAAPEFGEFALYPG